MTVKIRPKARDGFLWAGNYTFHDRDGSRSIGVGLLSHQRLIQHLTPEQAINLADQLVDAAEAATRGDTPVNFKRAGSHE
jgi:hypothetical protein